jgi:hypothetical protein
MKNKEERYDSIKLSPAWEKFFVKFKEIDTLPLKDWKSNNILSYWCRRYEDHYKVKYTLRFDNTSPSKSYEIYNIKKLSQMLSSDPVILKDYIDDFFSEYILAKKKRITSMAYLVNVDVVNKYKFQKLLNNGNNSIDRTKLLPKEITAITFKYDTQIIVYSDLAMVKDIERYKDMFSELKSNGFDIASLDRVK